MSAKFALAVVAMAATASSPVPAPESAHPPAPAATPGVAANALGLPNGSAPVAVPLQSPHRVNPAILPFAPEFSGLPAITSPAGWAAPATSDGWAGLTAATPATRQAARWAYARRALGKGLAAEALGALEVMAQDEPDIALVPSYQLALGATLARLNRPTAAVGALSGEALATNAEACAWRMLAYAEGDMPGEAIGQVQCAIPALNARPVADRARFLIPTARMAAAVGRPGMVLQLLQTLPSSDQAANLLRARAQLALGQLPQGKRLLAQIAEQGDVEQRLDAEVSLLEQAASERPLDAKSVDRLRHIRFVWRGGDVEQRAVQLAYLLARREHDLRGMLDAGATLFRYFAGGADRATLVSELHQTLADVMSPDNTMPLDQIAGLYWDYRDLSPAAADGDLLVSQFADRLQAAGLYGRAAELLEYQLLVRTRDIAQGPLSARVASLFILAGQPERALAAIRKTDANIYPDDMLWSRHRVEAVALDQLGKTEEALAVLQGVPDGPAITSEIFWKRRDWRALAVVSGPLMNQSQPVTEVMQARVLRYAIALAMLGNKDGLTRLRSRYGPTFAKLPAGRAFEALTAAVEDIDPAAVSSAMAALPSVSPAGETGDLMDAAPAAAPRPAA